MVTPLVCSRRRHPRRAPTCAGSVRGCADAHGEGGGAEEEKVLLDAAVVELGELRDRHIARPLMSCGDSARLGRSSSSTCRQGVSRARGQPRTDARSRERRANRAVELGGALVDVELGLQLAARVGGAVLVDTVGDRARVLTLAVQTLAAATCLMRLLRWRP